MRAALARLARKNNDLAPSGRLTPVNDSEGGANRLVRARVRGGFVFVKIRLARDDDAASEAWALKRLSDLGPTLLAHTTAASLRADAARDGDYAALLDLDEIAGGVLVLSEVPGKAPRRPLLGGVAMRAARAIHELHKKRPSTGPRLPAGSSPSALGGLAEQLLGVAEKRGAARAADVRLLARALASARARADAKRYPRVRTLCHGDLRLHNLHDDGERVRFLDLEHAGVGDPAVDLLLFRHKAPLSDLEELALLDAYPDVRSDRSRVDRYFALRPLVAVAGAIGGVVDLLDVARGTRPVAGDADEYIARRRDAVEQECERALDLALSLPRRPAVLRKKPRSKRAPAPGRVAIDGTASSGKSILARALAERARAPHVNTGALYRWVALRALERGLSPTRQADVDAVLAVVAKQPPRASDDGGLLVAGRRREEALYVFEVDEVVAEWARLPTVRDAVSEWLAPSLTARNIVVEGRDVATVLLPKARHRFFIDATPRVRAERTLGRLGRGVTLKSVLRSIEARDLADREREHAPMVPHADSIVVDTTRVDERQAVTKVLAAVFGEA